MARRQDGAPFFRSCRLSGEDASCRDARRDPGHENDIDRSVATGSPRRPVDQFPVHPKHPHLPRRHQSLQQVCRVSSGRLTALARRPRDTPLDCAINVASFSAAGLLGSGLGASRGRRAWVIYGCRHSFTRRREIRAGEAILLLSPAPCVIMEVAFLAPCSLPTGGPHVPHQARPSRPVPCRFIAQSRYRRDPHGRRLDAGGRLGGDRRGQGWRHRATSRGDGRVDEGMERRPWGQNEGHHHPGGGHRQDHHCDDKTPECRRTPFCLVGVEGKPFRITGITFDGTGYRNAGAGAADVYRGQLQELPHRSLQVQELPTG